MRDRLRRREPENEIEKRSKTFDQILVFLHIFFAGFMTLLVIYLFFIMVLEEKEEKGQYHLSAGDETDGFLLDYDSCLFFADKRCLSNDFAVN